MFTKKKVITAVVLAAVAALGVFVPGAGEALHLIANALLGAL